MDERSRGSRWWRRVVWGSFGATLLAGVGLLSPLPVLWSYVKIRQEGPLAERLVLLRFRVVTDLPPGTTDTWPRSDRAMAAYVRPYSTLAKSSPVVERFYDWYLEPVTRLEVRSPGLRSWSHSIGVTR